MSKSEKLSFSLPTRRKSSSSRSNQKLDQEKPRTQDESQRQYVTEFDAFDQEKPQTQDESQPQYVTEFDASKTLTPAPNIVIPPKENTWEPYKRMRNLPSSLQSDPNDLRFEAEVPSSESDTTSYGLHLRSRENGDENPPPSAPKSMDDITRQKFKDDMENLPEDRGLDEFKDVPVEGFGAALLGGYGWSEGKGIGRNVKKDVEIVQYLRPAGKEGIGFVPEFLHTEKNRGGRHPSDPPLVATKGPDGRTRHVVGIDEKLAPREPKGVFVGKVVRVVDGRHVGLKGKVVETSGGDFESRTVVLKLLKSGEEVSIGINQVAELGSLEEEKCLRKLQELKIREKDAERRDSSSRGYRENRESKNDKRRGEELEGDDKVHQSSNRDGGRREEVRLPVSWLTSHIRVRVISKDFKGGRLYLKKGEVMDVVGPTTCDISMDENKQLIQGVDQEILETALPKRGGPVLVLYGKHKGVFGNLVETDREREIAIIQDSDTRAFLKVRLEQISEYIGDPSYLGY